MLRLVSRFTAASLPASVDLRARAPRVGDVLVIGRDVAELGESGVFVDYVLSQEIMSRRHARIKHCEDGEYRLEDLNSTNGTWVNGVRLNPSDDFDLVSGTKISFGGTDITCIDGVSHENPYLFVFEDGEHPAPLSTPPLRSPSAAPAAPPVVSVSVAEPLSDEPLPDDVTWDAVHAVAAVPFRPPTPQRACPDGELAGLVTELSLCAVCLEVAVQPRAMTNCKHMFCALCIDRWIDAKTQSGVPREAVGCPTCRTAPAQPVAVSAWDELLRAVFVPTLDAEHAEARMQREREWHVRLDVRRRVEEAKRRCMKRTFNDVMLTAHDVAVRSARVPLVARYSLGRPAFRRRRTRRRSGGSDEETTSTVDMDHLERRRNVCTACAAHIAFGDVEVVDEGALYHVQCVPADLYGRRVTNAAGVGGLRDHDVRRLRAQPFIVG
jgi:pSer/pThr/pTyr-binding forkhead associated (FHA) protein